MTGLSSFIHNSDKANLEDVVETNLVISPLLTVCAIDIKLVKHLHYYIAMKIKNTY